MGDFKSIKLNELSWDKDNCEKSLDEIYKNVVKEAEEIIGWYLSAKNKKRKYARILRFFAIIFASLVGIIPVLGEIWICNETNKPVIAPIFSTFSLVMAAAFYGFDRFFGVSNGWMRYMDTQLRISEELKKFQFEWQEGRVGFNPEKTENIQDMLRKAKAFSDKVFDIIKDETDLWIADFKGSFQLLSNMIKEKGG